MALLVIVVLSLWLLASLQETEERTEKLLVELAVRRMRTGLQLAQGEAMMRGREREIANWVGLNPTRWLDGALQGYAGYCGRRSELAAGAWCYDAVFGELLYRPRLHQHLRLKNGGDVPLLSWKVVAENPTAQDGMVGLQVKNVTPYEWFAE